MTPPRCNQCGERHEIWDECQPGTKGKKMYPQKKEPGARNGVPRAAPAPQPRMRPEALKLYWHDGRVSVLLGRTMTESTLIEKIVPLYPGLGGGTLNYHDATEQLAFSMHGVTLNQLDDKEAERVRHLTHVTLKAALGVS